MNIFDQHILRALPLRSAQKYTGLSTLSFHYFCPILTKTGVYVDKMCSQFPASNFMKIRLEVLKQTNGRSDWQNSTSVGVGGIFANFSFENALEKEEIDFLN
jgi:hypothetical protein